MKAISVAVSVGLVVLAWVPQRTGWALEPSKYAVDFDGDGVSSEAERLLFQAWVEAGADEAAILKQGVQRGSVIDLSNAFAKIEAEASTAMAASQGGSAPLMAETSCDSLALNTSSEVLLADIGATWRYFKGTEDPPADWKKVSYDDSVPGSGWNSGATGIGYVDCGPATVLDDMRNHYSSIYARLKIDLSLAARPDAWKFNSIRLKMDFDDGYVAYLNELENDRHNLPIVGVTLHFDTLASGEHESVCAGASPQQIRSDEWDSFGPPGSSPLTLGTNILAVEVHNVTLNSDDMVFRPQVFAYKRGPFVAIGSPTSTHIVFNTLEPRKGRIKFGLTPTSLDMTVTESSSKREHDIVLSNPTTPLMPGMIAGTTYYYKVLASRPLPVNFEEFDSQTFCFDTPKEGALYTDFNFVAFGDCGVDTVGEGGNDPSNGSDIPPNSQDHQELIANRLVALNPQPDFALVAGDVIYLDGQRQSFDRRHFFPYRNTMPKKWFYQVVGNHDTHLPKSSIESPFDFSGGAFCKAFVLPTNNQEPNLNQRELYYSFDWGIVHLTALDLTQPAAPPPANEAGRWNQLNQPYQQTMKMWATSDINNSTAFWKVAFFHFPPYTYQHRGRADGELGHDEDENLREDFGSFFDNKVDLVITGHEHVYERTYPLLYSTASPPNPEVPTRVNVYQEPDYMEPHAPIYVVTGGGGRSLYFDEPAQPVSGGGVENFRAKFAREFHLTRVTVLNNQLTISALKHDGTILDTFTITKGWTFVRGDANNDNKVDVSDSIYILSYLFSGGPAPVCMDAADANDDGKVDVSEGIYIFSYLFNGTGPPPPPPFPNCGQDPTADQFQCLSPTICPLQ